VEIGVCRLLGQTAEGADRPLRLAKSKALETIYLLS
jgi:hypothetical protein